jgi:hypothetical protein
VDLGWLSGDPHLEQNFPLTGKRVPQWLQDSTRPAAAIVMINFLLNK